MRDIHEWESNMWGIAGALQQKCNNTNMFVKIINRLKEVSVFLMQHENKDYCTTGVSPYLWRAFGYNDTRENQKIFVIVPSFAFYRFILNKEYLKIVDNYPNYFGQQNDWLIVKAIKEHEKRQLIREYTDEEYLEYIRGETMAYVFQVDMDGVISDRVLRLDLCRGINKSNVFQGGFLHALKHFTVKGYETLSSFNKEYEVDSWYLIYRLIIKNFFLGSIENDCKENFFIAKSEIDDKHVLRGTYYKEANVPASFISSIRIESKT
ncbi:MAG: hypothetical protein IJE99_03755 [Alistipes sp.]|nr:hypothetical protein [Alistipes sp.]